MKTIKHSKTCPERPGYKGICCPPCPAFKSKENIDEKKDWFSMYVTYPLAIKAKVEADLHGILPVNKEQGSGTDFKTYDRSYTIHSIVEVVRLAKKIFKATKHKGVKITAYPYLYRKGEKHRKHTFYRSGRMVTAGISDGREILDE